MRNPNGYGTVVKLSGTRRRPYAVRITTGWELNEKTGRAIQKTKYVGYYEKKSDALKALAAYTDTDTITIAELYARWSAEHFAKISASSASSYSSCRSIFDPIQNYNIKDVNLDTLQRAADLSGKNTPALKNFRTVAILMFEYAFIHEYIDPNHREIPKYINVGNKNPKKIERRNFTPAEISQFWEHKDDPLARLTLILLYTGLRVNELLKLSPENVNVENQSIKVVKSKTAAGVRVVPIADKILPLVQDMLSDAPVNYQMFRTYLQQNTEHRPHDTRHTFISMCTDKNIDPRVIKQIVGHSGGNVTEAVYTHISLKTLLDAVNRL